MFLQHSNLLRFILIFDFQQCILIMYEIMIFTPQILQMSGPPVVLKTQNHVV
jgi:hypothetical protein